MNEKRMYGFWNGVTRKVNRPEKVGELGERFLYQRLLATISGQLLCFLDQFSARSMYSSKSAMFCLLREASSPSGIMDCPTLFIVAMLVRASVVRVP